MPIYTLEYTPLALGMMKSTTIKSKDYADFIYNYTQVVEGTSEHPVPVFVFAKELNKPIDYGRVELACCSEELAVHVGHMATSVEIAYPLCLDNQKVAVTDYLTLCSAGEASKTFKDLDQIIPTSTLTATFVSMEDTDEIAVVMCIHVERGVEHMLKGIVTSPSSDRGLTRGEPFANKIKTPEPEVEEETL